MKLIRTEEAVGHVLCHDLTQIIKGDFKGPRFRKGHIVTEADIPVLLSMGKENLYVWEMVPGMVHENDAAERLRIICQGEHMIPSAVKEGKIELKADCDGLLLVDVPRLDQINLLGDIMVATRHSGTAVKAGDKLCGTRVIPLVIEEEKLLDAEAIGGDQPLLQLLPYRLKTAGVITTGTEVFKGLIQDTFTPVIEEKLRPYGITMTEHITVDDGLEHVAKALAGYLANLVARAGLFALSFLLILLIWFLVSHILDLAFHLPILATVNTVGGLVAGLLKAVLIVFVLVWLGQLSNLIPQNPTTPILTLFTPKGLAAFLDQLLI